MIRNYYGKLKTAPHPLLLLPSRSGAHVPSVSRVGSVTEEGTLYQVFRACCFHIWTLKISASEAADMLCEEAPDGGDPDGGRPDGGGPRPRPTVLAELPANISTTGQTHGSLTSGSSSPAELPPDTHRAQDMPTQPHQTADPWAKINDCWKPLRFKVFYNVARDNRKNLYN